MKNKNRYAKGLQARVREYSFNQVPPYRAYPDIHDMTVKALIAALRKVDWGAIGTATIRMSDNSMIEVVLEHDDSGRIMNTQYVRRVYPADSCKPSRVYKLK